MNISLTRRITALLIPSVFICTAFAAQVEMSYAIRDDSLQVNFDVEAHLHSSFLEKIDSGLTAAVSVTVSLFRFTDNAIPGDNPLSSSVLECEFRFDPWQEIYRISVRDGESHRTYPASEREEALYQCAGHRWFILVPVEDLDLRRRYIIEVLINTDPGHFESRARAREYLANPAAASGSRSSGGRSIFGTVAKVFFRQQEESLSSVTRLMGIPFGEPLIRQALSAAEYLESQELFRTEVPKPLNDEEIIQDNNDIPYPPETEEEE